MIFFRIELRDNEPKGKTKNGVEKRSRIKQVFHATGRGLILTHDLTPTKISLGLYRVFITATKFL